MLSPADVASYRQNGYLTIPDLLNQTEVQALQDELARLLAEGLLRNVARAGDGVTPTTMANLQICPIGPHSRLVRSLPFDERIVAITTVILGDAVRQRLDQIFLKPAHHGMGTGWHQDNNYFREAQGDDNFRGLGIWIAIHEATAANGTMRIVPHRQGEVLEHVRDGNSNHHRTCAAEIDESQAITIEVPAGGALVFSYGVPHCTGANTTDHDRAGLALHFQDASLSFEAKALTPIIAGPGANGGVDEYGEDLRGVWQELTAPASV